MNIVMSALTKPLAILGLSPKHGNHPVHGRISAPAPAEQIFGVVSAAVVETGARVQAPAVTPVRLSQDGPETGVAVTDAETAPSAAEALAHKAASVSTTKGATDARSPEPTVAVDGAQLEDDLMSLFAEEAQTDPELRRLAEGLAEVETDELLRYSAEVRTLLRRRGVLAGHA